MNGSFKIDYLSFFKDSQAQNNFCQRNAVIIEFPRKLKSPCKINICYQYRQFTKEDHPFIKIVAFCENGPCRHEYIINDKPSDGSCDVHFSIHSLFLNENICTPIHDCVASTPLKGQYRERMAAEVFRKRSFKNIFGISWSNTGN
jgi:hypothetical protein